jgi:hypothetical protein
VVQPALLSFIKEISVSASFGSVDVGMLSLLSTFTLTLVPVQSLKYC